MRKNYFVSGIVSLFVDDILYVCLEYNTKHQRSVIIDSFIDRTKNLIGKRKIYYVISIDESSVREFNRGSIESKEKKQEPLIRPQGKYSNK